MDIKMRFDNLPTTPYLNIILDIIRLGIKECTSTFNTSQNEGYKNQKISDTLNIIGTSNENLWIGVNKENISEGKQAREDIYFYLNDDSHTRIFYIEGKRLPKYKTKNKEEYIIGINSHGNPSGGIERFKKGIHGNPNKTFNNGLIAYVENKSIDFWLKKINETIKNEYNLDERISPKYGFTNEFISSHNYECRTDNDNLILHHFWIDISKNI